MYIFRLTTTVSALLGLAWGLSMNERFYEELAVRALGDGRVASTFSFKTVLNGSVPRDPTTLGQDDESQHYTLFPLAMGQILREYALSELHLTLNAGSWDYDRWGYPDEATVGSGAELWTWMADGGPTSVDARWEGVRNALGGLFCASLGSLNEQRTTSPESTFAPEGDLPDWGQGQRHHLRHASLPSENVCTENLTPFVKLLPCKTLSGIASLLNPHRLFDADWHGLGVHVVWREGSGVEVRLVIQAVSNPWRLSLESTRDWSFNSLYQRQISRTCPVATASTMSVSFPPGQSSALHPQALWRDGDASLYNLAEVPLPFDLQVKSSAQAGMTVPEQHHAPLRVQRTLNGPSQGDGRLSVSLTNPDDEVVYAEYLETMPWLVQFYLHTLQLHCNQTLRNDLASGLYYIPSVPHSRPSTLQLTLEIPPHSTIVLSMEVAKSFLRYTDHPPDAQRGWDLPPAVITPFLRRDQGANDTMNTKVVLPRMYTSNLLVDPATPDFSMPYNVIIFSSSLIAFLFGSIFNLLTRKFVVVSMKDAQ